MNLETIRGAMHPITGDGGDYDALLEMIGDAHLVLIGEASHGTHEFYRERAKITKRLIDEKGFHAVAVEADWPDAYRVNRYVRATSNDNDATEAWKDSKRASRRGCGATPTCSISSDGCAASTMRCATRGRRSASTASISIRSSLRSKR